MTDQTARSIKHMAEKVKFLRVYDGLSLKELAKEIKLNSMHIEAMEKGAKHLELNDVIRYCEFFCLDYESFMFDEFPTFKNLMVDDDKKILKTIGYNV